ncbi:MAG: helix-turn-helix protein [Nocardioidaceae bacterium]|nr:helix-turn-helix protein [Nocardioidaceae bacterium]
MDARTVARLRRLAPETLGSRIKSARIAAGLTQMGLADGDVTISFVSRIESGKRRLDPTLLERFAERMGVTVSDLLADEADATGPNHQQVDIEFAELALEMGDASSALARLEGVLAAPDTLTSSDRARAGLLRARALESLGRLLDAIDALELLAESENDATRKLTLGIVLSRCYREAGELGRAIESGERLLAGLTDRGLATTDESIQLVVTIAAAYFEQGDTAYAVRLCRRAVEQAENHGTSRARASAYWNAGMMELDEGNTVSAISLARRALALLGEGQDARNLGRLRSELGLMLLRLDDPPLEEATEHLLAARAAMEGSDASVVDLASNEVELARCLSLQGSFEEAERTALAITERLAGNAPIVDAEALAVAGQAAAGRGDAGQARDYLVRAVHRLTAVGADRAAAQLWMDIGDVLTTLDDAEGASNAYRSAAASTGLLHRTSRTTSSLASDS